jgi:homoserine kinase
LHKILRLRAPGLLACALSSSGPSILVFFERGYESVCRLAVQIFRLHGHEAETLHCSIPERRFELTRE